MDVYVIATSRDSSSEKMVSTQYQCPVNPSSPPCCPRLFNTFVTDDTVNSFGNIMPTCRVPLSTGMDGKVVFLYYIFNSALLLLAYRMGSQFD
ncbi:hypothetical protein KIN20_027772 [Parelaphostrongylus tenuis]|uniref:Uncharacterized protein n=1 Tax=Parelaphostrongylus tenuis TaxID=148309 RepID=A0AAD5R035_PARTN|nr:hypothetical protein KIN20_027772 [Parelaphostrongylus tenuis]